MKKKALLACFFLLLLFLLAACGGTPASVSADPPADDPAPAETAALSEAEQLRLIAAHSEEWRIKEDYRFPFYAVSDLDGNGRLELISAVMEGSGMFSTNRFYEVSPDGTALIPCFSLEEGSSEPDIIVERMPVYVDQERNINYYIVSDTIRNGYAETYLVDSALSLQEGVICCDLLASCSILASSAEDWTISYYDRDHQEIDEAAYRSAPADIFAGCTLMEANFGWVELAEGCDVAALLIDSWSDFSLQEPSGEDAGQDSLPGELPAVG